MLDLMIHDTPCVMKLTTSLKKKLREEERSSERETSLLFYP